MFSEVQNMDCVEGMKVFPDKFFDLAVCDVPYGIRIGKMAYLGEIKTTVKQKNGTRLNGNRNKKPYAKKEWDNQTPDQNYFDELKRVSKHQIVFGIDYVNWKGVGSGRIKWDKCVAEGVSFKRFETAYCSMIDDEITIPLLWSGMFQAKSLQAPTIQQGNKKLNEKRIHPCHKPIMLYDAIYDKFGFYGMNVIDTHLGGGSNRISAYKNDINFWGFELDKDYFEAQEKRFKEQTAQMKLFAA